MTGSEYGIIGVVIFLLIKETFSVVRQVLKGKNGHVSEKDLQITRILIEKSIDKLADNVENQTRVIENNTNVISQLLSRLPIK